MKVVRHVCKVKVEYLEGSTVRYTYPCGHTRKETIMIGPKSGRGWKKLQRPLGPDLLKKMVPYWNSAGGLSMTECPICKRRQKR